MSGAVILITGDAFRQDVTVEEASVKAQFAKLAKHVPYTLHSSG